eukprot:1590179-Amphidinium_carterae.2
MVLEPDPSMRQKPVPPHSLPRPTPQDAGWIPPGWGLAQNLSSLGEETTSYLAAGLDQTQ